jgi:hypothetical protein
VCHGRWVCVYVYVGARVCLCSHRSVAGLNVPGVHIGAVLASHRFVAGLNSKSPSTGHDGSIPTG